jgi:hypothetical protein
MGTSMESLPTIDKNWENFIRGVELVIQPNGFPKEIHALKWSKEKFKWTLLGFIHYEQV